MPYDWSEFLRLAQILMANPPEGVQPETVLRCVINRLYYGAFGHALRYAVNHLGFTPRELADDHGRLPEHLKRRRRMEVGKKLQRLRDWRNACDYGQETVRNLEDIVKEASKAAEYVFRALPEPPTSTAP
jgi:hypothetical protein